MGGGAEHIRKPKERSCTEPQLTCVYTKKQKNTKKSLQGT